MSDTLAPPSADPLDVVHGVGEQPERPPISDGQPFEERPVVACLPAVRRSADALDEMGEVGLVRADDVQDRVVATLVDPPQDAAFGRVVTGLGEGGEHGRVHPLW